MEQERVALTPQPRPVFSKEQKVGYAVVIGCGALAVILGFLYIGTHLNAPFLITYEGERLLLGDEKEAQAIAEQQAKDTDSDTLNDYDELYVYGTSPYLADTDSDGVTDDVEVSANTDPTCAMGQTCSDDVDEVSGATGVAGDLATDAAAAASEAAAQYTAMKELLASMTPDEVRTMLLESGADKATVDAMSDEEVAELYSQVLAQLEASGGMDQILEQAAQAGE